MNSLGWSRREPAAVSANNASSETPILSKLQSLNPFAQGGYVRLPLYENEAPGAPLPARTRREEEEGWFACTYNPFVLTLIYDIRSSIFPPPPPSPSSFHTPSTTTVLHAHITGNGHAPQPFRATATVRACLQANQHYTLADKEVLLLQVIFHAPLSTSNQASPT